MEDDAVPAPPDASSSDVTVRDARGADSDAIAELIGELGYPAVAGDVRRRGVGRTLVDAIETIAREGGCARVEVTSNDRRADAHAFYQGLGYEQASRRFVKAL